jgi:predicted transcriptional regulator
MLYFPSMSKELADTLRITIRKSGLPLLTIAKESGVAVSTLSEFMDGADMRLKTASKIAAYLGLELKKPK